MGILVHNLLQLKFWVFFAGLHFFKFLQPVPILFLIKFRIPLVILEGPVEKIAYDWSKCRRHQHYLRYLLPVISVLQLSPFYGLQNARQLFCEVIIQQCVKLIDDQVTHITQEQMVAQSLKSVNCAHNYVDTTIQNLSFSFYAVC